MPMEGGATNGGRNPRTTEAILDDYANRREGLLTALTQDVEKLYGECNPERENLCLYGLPDGGWAVDLPAEEVPPELPEPTLGINFARDGMARKDWLALVAVHSDAWLIAVAFYYGAKLEPKAKMRLFRGINEYPTLYELITGQYRQNGTGAKRQRVENFQSNREAQASEAPLPTGRLLTYNDITPALKGRQAELYWPDDRMWYLVEIHSVSARQRQAKIQYTSGEFEDLDLEEIIREGHMSLITQ